MLTTRKKMMFLLTLTMGTLLSISSTSWYGAWMGLEINLMSFIPLISAPNNQRNTEASLKYFLIQALASSMILAAALIMINAANFNMQTQLLTMALLMKMGAAPFHIWMPEVMEGMTWINCLVMTTIQKIAPSTLLSYVIDNLNMILILTISMSAIIGAIGGLNQTSLRKIMAFSSINHMSWIILSMTSEDNTWLTYLLLYILMTTSAIMLFSMNKTYYIHQLFMLKLSPIKKMSLFMSMLSLGGLPPLLGFLPKWMVIIQTTNLKQLVMVMILISMSLLTLYYYLRTSLTSILMNYKTNMWNIINNNPLNLKEQVLSVVTIFLSVCGLPMIQPIYMSL